MPTARYKRKFLLIALLGVTLWTYANADLCDGLGSPEQIFVKISMKIIMSSKNKTIDTCLVKDNQPCITFDEEPGQYPSADFLSDKLKRQLPGIPLTFEKIHPIPPIAVVKDNCTFTEGNGFDALYTNRLNEIAVEFKSLFCRSGYCAWHVNNFYCGAAKPPPTTIDFRPIQEKLRVYQVDRGSKPILESVCAQTIGKNRKDYKNLFNGAGETFTPGRGLIQHKPGGPILEVAVCFVPRLFPCFPFNESESVGQAWTIYYDNDLGLLPKLNLKDPVFTPTTTEKNGPKRKLVTYKLKTTKRLFLKKAVVDWFCANGACEIGNCKLLNASQRGRPVLKLYENLVSRSTRGHGITAFTLLMTAGLVVRHLFLKILN